MFCSILTGGHAGSQVECNVSGIYLLMALTSTAVTVVMSTSVLRAFHRTDTAPPPSILLKLCFIRTMPNDAVDNGQVTTPSNAVDNGQITNNLSDENNAFVDVSKIPELDDPEDQTKVNEVRLSASRNEDRFSFKHFHGTIS